MKADNTQTSHMWPDTDSRNMIKLLLDLAQKLNNNFFAAGDLTDILNAVLVGVTAGEGLGFNRAVFFEYNTARNRLQGKLAVGPANLKEANAIWHEIEESKLTLFDIMDRVKDELGEPGDRLNNIIKGMTIPLSGASPVARSIRERRAVHITTDTCSSCSTHCFCRQINSDECVIVPLYAQEETFGIIFADNFVTKNAITQDDINALHLFASLASMAVYQTKLYEMMNSRLRQMEQLNQELEKSRDRIVAAERYTALGRMSDQLLHEIRNPFSVIGGLAKLLERKNSDKALENYISTIVTHSRRIEQSLDNLAEFVNLPELAKEPVYICQLIRASVDLLKSEMDRHHIAWHVSLPEADPLLLLDRNHFQQAILNVMRNAIEAMADGGMLIVAMERKDNAYEIRITDTGLGIAKGHIKKVDEPFFTTKTHSMGLGLSLAKRTVEMHNGQLHITKNRIGGTTTIFLLPDNIPS